MSGSRGDAGLQSRQEMFILLRIVYRADWKIKAPNDLRNGLGDEVKAMRRGILGDKEE